MKKLLLLFIINCCIAGISFSQNINGRFSSSIYTFERFDSVNSSSTYARAFQNLSLNFNKDIFSLRTSLNLENELSAKMDNDPRVRFYNLYLEARNIANVATIKLGRQPIFNSVGGGVFDGANLDLKYSFLKLNGFYGGSTPAYQKLELIDNFKDNSIYGGTLSASPLEELLVSLSYVNKNFMRQAYDAIRLGPDLNPITVHIMNQSNQFQFASAEVSYDMKEKFSVDTRYDYDINLEKSSRFEFNADYKQVKNLNVNIYYNYREPRVGYNSIFSVFDYGNSQEIEVGADYTIMPQVTVTGKFGNVKFKDENSSRLSLGVGTRYGNIFYRKNLGWAGELDNISLYSAYSLLEGLVTPSLGLSYTTYKLSKDDPTNNLVSLLAGVNIRPYRSLSFDLQGQYLDNKIYKNDMRLFFRINYWFNTNLNLM